MKRLMHFLWSLATGRGRVRTPEEFQQLFRRFRDVMDGNTRALEIITEMGDVLGGDYLFDIQYVRRSHSRLTEQLRQALGHFDALTAGRYPELRTVHDRIDGAIRSGIEGGASADGPSVLWLEMMTEDQSGIAGGKMANLASVKQHLPFLVPDGFIVTTTGFDDYIRHNRLHERVPRPAGDIADDRSWREEAAGILLHGEIPSDLHRSIDKAVRKLRLRNNKECYLAVRSSAGEEDGRFSFAGQYRTILNVPLEVEAAEKAYRKVLASLFSERAVAYQQRSGFAPGAIKMAVGFLAMVDAVAGGVLYTADPAGRSGRMMISAAWGLGTSVVDGRVDPDHFITERDGRVVERRIGRKTRMTMRRRGGGTREKALPEDRGNEQSISAEQVAELVRAGVRLEEHFGCPQDVEWSIDADGTLFILQSRPLRLPEAGPREAPGAASADAVRIAFRNAGTVVQRGSAAGTVHIAKTARGLDAVPRGAILVVRHDSPNLVRVMPVISAIITDTGSMTSHMASLAREFRVPTVVNTGDATRALTEGRHVTVVLADEAAVYDGSVAAEPAPAGGPSAGMEDLHEFRRKRYLLRHIAPLNLVDPFRDDFSPGACRTLHDILRFMHEKSVGRLIEAAGFGSRSSGAVNLDLPIPAGILVIDIGGGLRGTSGQGHALPEHIASAPLRAIIEGMTHPGVWRSEAVPLTVNDFFNSMFRAPELVAESERQAGMNVAVVSREYVNLNIKFGYHYTIVDSYVSDTPRSNHIYFRFAGGATDMTKRSRRLRVIALLLEERGFSLSTKGDMIIARISNIGREETASLLEEIGRLISYTRQLDALLRTDDDVEWFAGNFLKGQYELKCRDREG